MNRTFKVVKNMSLIIITLLGKGSTRVKDLPNHALVIPSDSATRIQATHILTSHVAFEPIEKELRLD